MNVTRAEAAHYIEDFINGTGGRWDWDDFISLRIKNDAELEAIRHRCARLPAEFPPVKPGTYCSDAGIELLRAFLLSLKSRADGAPAA